MLKLDLSKLATFLPQDYAAQRQDRLAKAAQMLDTHTGPGGDFTGWVYLQGPGGHRHRRLLSGGAGCH